MKRSLVFLLAVTAGACQEAAQPLAPTPGHPLADQRPSGEPVLDQYIVVLREDAEDVRGLANRLAAANGGRLGFVYENALRGFSVRLPAAAAAALARHPQVELVEQDQTVSAMATQSNATWGLDRVDQRNLPLSTTFAYQATGAGVNAYIVDTGVLLGHAEFAGRISSGFDAVDGGSADDCHGHGTHVAGTVGGTTYGVAKGVSLVAVRVLDCGGSGTNSGVIAGIDWITANHVKPAVANMSLGGGASTALDNAVRKSIAAGVTYAIAAGNGNFLGFAQDACKSSPARVAEAITVGATDKTDKKASWSNYGSCLDLFGPGVGITSAWHTGASATNTISGTSMATPHVAGVAALYLQGSAGATPAAVRNAIVNATTTGKVTSAGRNSPNRLLFTAY